ncbi:DUF5313 family protein [Nocardia cyriacigeorgica]|uniref:DUF5313 domain-containing protein n=1 Tax=Nocardia cyriacigeorgica TaxID=135487 RepID=A0A4U8WAB5_9NOCA|nr:DUF5313 family protein [Nocardia cyriacigeorgica]MBF6101208.1 DUF5313 family protein [Nocardia cyriacigeorgica]MBF6158185.1 DUF5313 family protein [Nocardia cyriacigeorgica]MBF6197156.1 DUF5313 family protein [Nocardia cyriacigeorgica]MBF6317572.1 DUF5313 family protein [Nocardia cyriacigeorgica]MBF6344699.1 DUF5313 family protein [Nocardia cyriacigeorgica]
MSRERRRPNPIQWLGYACGRKLPDSMRDWVRNDLTGKYAFPRHVLRGLVPFVPLFAVFLFFPGELWLRGSMVLLALLLALFYTVAFMPMNRAHRLAKHGLPADLENPDRAERRAKERARYAAQHPH